MITRCPQCRAWFRVRAEHLKVANGYVTCGDCDAVFNALQTLVEESTPPPVLPDAVAPPPLPPAADTARASPTHGDPEPAASRSARIETGIEAHEDAAGREPGASPAVAPPQARSTRDAADAPSGQVESTAPGPAPAAGPDRSGAPPPDAGARAGLAEAAPAAAAPEPAADARALNDGPPAVTVQPEPARASPQAEPAPVSAASRTEDGPAFDADDAERASAADPSENARSADAAERASPPATDGAERVIAAGGPAAAPPEQGTDESPAGIEYDLFGAEFDDALADPGDSAAPAASPAETPDLVSGHTLSADEHAILFTRPGADGEQDDEQEEDDDYEDTVPEYDPSKAPAILQSDIERLAAGRRPPTGRATRALVAVLLTVAAAQIAWLQREQLTGLVPAVRPAVDALCRTFGCGDGKGARADTIRLLARDVREHPQYREALLVNATLLNTGATSQPYPVIELSLHDAVGAVLGARRFEPDEYLDESIAIAEGMPPNRPVYVVMELGGDALAAISFEFTFL